MGWADVLDRWTAAAPSVHSGSKYFPEDDGWYRMVAGNLARAEIKPYAHLFDGRAALTVFDCGANRGCWTRAAFATFPRAVVHAHIFEPSSKNSAFIADRAHGLLFTDEQFRTVTVNRMAVSDAPGELALYSDWDGSWLGSLVKRPDVPANQSEMVPVTTVDAYAAAHGIAEIDILKLDVEGFELHALKGASGLLSRGAVRLVLFEFSTINVYTRTFFYDFWTLLTPLGFELFFLDRERLQHITEYAGRWEQFAGTVLYVAKHKSLA
jgi:FkbM family methyltransferase